MYKYKNEVGYALVHQTWAIFRLNDAAPKWYASCREEAAQG